MTDIDALPPSRVSGESRRSTRVTLKVLIDAQGVTEHVACEGETITVNLHGALISTAVALRVGMKIDIHVYLTGKRANADVVYVDPERPLHCGISLTKAQNIWEYLCPPKTGLRAILSETPSGSLVYTLVGCLDSCCNIAISPVTRGCRCKCLFTTVTFGSRKSYDAG